MYATLAGDVTICSAYSHELPKFGMKAGLTNYAATYATGLLCARRLLTKYGLAETYEGNTDDIGQEYHVEAEDDERRPFKCFLDVGLVRTSTGSRVFAALKGAVDGGLDIPHNDKRYAGYDLQDKPLDTETLERYIKGGVVAEYAEEMQAFFLDRDTPDWEIAFAHAIYAHAAYVAGDLTAHARAYRDAALALEAIADPEDQMLVRITFDQVPPPEP